MQIIRLIKDLSVKSTRSSGNALCQEHEQFASEHDRNVPTFPLCPFAKKEYQIASYDDAQTPFLSSFRDLQVVAFASRDSRFAIIGSSTPKFVSRLSENIDVWNILKFDSCQI